ncbi:sigma-E factor regulatory protein RseB [Enterobacteriaceae bacterium LUAb1]
MKPYWCAISLLAGTLFCVPVAQAKTASGALLQQMELASQSLDYELAFINVSRQGIESLRYRHAIIDKIVYAQLLQMDGPHREVLQKGHSISYFEPGLEPFTLKGGHIIDSLPSLVYADFQRLSASYDFISAGRTRVADQLCEVIRIVSRDGTRYSYIVWLDTDTRLPLRVDLLDRNGDTLEQYRVISFAVDKGVRNLLHGLSQAKLPPFLSMPPTISESFNWKVGWLPTGMTQISQSVRDIPALSQPTESLLFSDGLFSVSVNVNAADSRSREQMLRTGRRTMQTVIRNKEEITVVGEIPPATAKRIADSVIFGLTQ